MLLESLEFCRRCTQIEWRVEECCLHFIACGPLYVEIERVPPYADFHSWERFSQHAKPNPNPSNGFKLHSPQRHLSTHEIKFLLPHENLLTSSIMPG